VRLRCVGYRAPQKYLPGHAAPAGSRADDDKGGQQIISRYLKDDILERVQGLRPIADDPSLTMAQLAVAWVRDASV
jgi:aryl-alcohol dehydrogenase-like predicted oxidoreductase